MTEISIVKISHIHLVYLQQKAFSVGLSIRKPIQPIISLFSGDKSREPPQKKPQENYRK